MLKAIFDNLYFFVSGSIELKERKQLVEKIKKNGGSLEIGVSKKTTHLILNEKEIIEEGLKVRTAYRMGTCFVVLPSFIFDSCIQGKKLNEWNYSIIAGKPATYYADNEEEYIALNLEKALSNIISFCVGSNSVERSLFYAVQNIRALSIEMISKYDEPEKFSGKNVTQMVNSLHSILAQPKKENKPNPVSNSTFLPFNLTKNTSSYINPILKSNKSSFLERSSLKRKEFEEKIQRMEQEKQRKEEVRRKKEEDRIKKRK